MAIKCSWDHPPTTTTTASVGNPSWRLSNAENQVLSMLCGVPTPIVPPINNLCAVSPPPSIYFLPPQLCPPIKKVYAVFPLSTSFEVFSLESPWTLDYVLTPLPPLGIGLSVVVREGGRGHSSALGKRIY